MTAVTEQIIQKKRKRTTDEPTGGRSKRRAVEEADVYKNKIVQLEDEIAKSRRHYNNIATLLAIAGDTSHGQGNARLQAAVSLCRVFCRLLAGGGLVAVKGTPQNEITIVQWLKEKYKRFTELLLDLIREGNTAQQSAALRLVLQLVREESTYLKIGHEYAWRTGLFARFVKAVLEGDNNEVLRREYVEDFVGQFDDIRCYTLQIVSDILPEVRPIEVQQVVLSNSMHILSAIEFNAETSRPSATFYGEKPTKSNHQVHSITAHKRAAQAAWLALLRQNLTKDMRKFVLSIMTRIITPWFLQLELLMDFLTDSYNVGGATSLLAISGLFYLIKEKNLDYPSFYQKLYILLDEDLLHSKYRSQFFRLLDTFMSSTHLPAALVASFIKRLARLALHAPPAGIVIVIPWIYNMLMMHPTCTFMIHRESLHAVSRKALEENGMEDPFDMTEQDPMQTHALESSLWELVNLQHHYHPNVATLAKIISEQFTKREYNLEDFLDHSYISMLDAELKKDLKKAPVVEWEIPKEVFRLSDTEPGQLEVLMTSLLQPPEEAKNDHC